MKLDDFKKQNYYFFNKKTYLKSLLKIIIWPLIKFIYKIYCDNLLNL